MRITIIIVLLVIGEKLMAQLYGAQWVLGDNVSVMDFRYDTLVNYTVQSNAKFTLTNANICDEQGNLLYFTNGLALYNKDGDLLQNGDSLSPCPYTFAYQIAGLNIQQAALFLPKPGDTEHYYLFHFSNDTMSNSRPGNIYHSVIDKNGNNGLGVVIEKNVSIISDVTLREGGMTACKHANGRDYWLVMGALVKNEFYKFLVTPDSIFGPYLQTTGPEYPGPGDIAYSKFSQDGSKYVTVAYVGYVLVMDFDRCTGEFSNPVKIYNSATNDPINHPATGGVAVEFSLNNRFVYVTNPDNLTQYDLQSTNVQDSVVVYYNDTDFFGIHMVQLAPNGKLYASTWDGGTYYLHVVNYPDKLGDSCGFADTGYVTLTDNSFNLPNMINYALGPLMGSGCDTITDVRQLTEDTRQIRLLPNPADKYLYVEMPMQGDYELDLINEVGQVVAIRQTPQVDIFDTESLAAGVYFVKVTDKQRSNNNVVTQKVVVVH